MHAIMNGEETTGITVLELSPEAFDVGRVLFQKSLVCRAIYGALFRFKSSLLHP